MKDQTIRPLEVGDDFEQPILPPNGASTTAEVNAAVKPLFSGVSAKAANRAKKGDTSSSRTGRAKQISFALGKPKKTVYTKVHPSPAYSMTNVPVFQNEATGTWHFVTPELYESETLPDRFQRTVKLMDIFAAGNADGSFYLWYVPVTGHQSRQGALKAVEAARQRYILVEWFRAASTYTIEPATEPIDEPRWDSLPPLEKMILDAFTSVVSVADDKVVRDFMSGGAAYRKDIEQEDGE